MASIKERNGAYQITVSMGRDVYGKQILKYNADKAEADKLPMIPFHGLRHTKATLQIAAGTDVRTVSAILGHRETSTTMNIYSHSLQTAEQEAAANMERFLSKQA